MIPRKNWYLIVLLVYAAGYVLFPPRVAVINDEERYVTQAMAFARGELTIPGANTILPPAQNAVASDYPPGTSLLQAPLVHLGGWRAAGLVSVIGLIALTVFTALLLRVHGLHEGFALLVPAFLGALFFGRVAMSDVPNAALVALALWLLASAERNDQKQSFLAGLAAGATLLFREPSAVLLAPFVVAAIVRRQIALPALLFGGVLAVGTRLAISNAMFGDALYVRDSGYGFSLASGLANLPAYALVLLIMIPMGALLPFLYRGPRRQEMLASFALYSLLFVFYDYRPWHENGPAKGTILASRFMIPLLPLFAVMAGDVLERTTLLQNSRTRLVLFLPGFLALVVGAFAIHPLFRRLEAEPYGIMVAVRDHTSGKVPVIMNEKAAGKYLSPVYSDRRLIFRSAASTPGLELICREFGGMQLVLLDRSDSEMFREDAAENAKFLANLEQHLQVRTRYDRAHGKTFHLRIFDVSGCSPSAGA